MHVSGGGVQFEAKMNFQRPARSFRFSGFAHGIDLDQHVLRAPYLCAAGSF